MKTAHDEDRLHGKDYICLKGLSAMAQWVKNLPVMQETQEMQVQSLGWENPLEKPGSPVLHHLLELAQTPVH